jgi:hypothetical protein
MQFFKSLLLSLTAYFIPTDPIPPYPHESWSDLPHEHWPAGYDPESDSFLRVESNRYPYPHQESSVSQPTNALLAC